MFFKIFTQKRLGFPSLFVICLFYSVSLKNVEIKKPFTLMFGNESHGLENFDLKGTTPVFIEQSEDIDSFNLPIASSIAMYKFTEKE